jgi:hypothetical protein
MLNIIQRSGLWHRILNPLKVIHYAWSTDGSTTILSGFLLTSKYETRVDILNIAKHISLLNQSMNTRKVYILNGAPRKAHSDWFPSNLHILD